MNGQFRFNYDTLAQSAEPLHAKIRARRAKQRSLSYEKGIRTYLKVDPVLREAVRVFHER
jgi:hypothetical protein